MRYTSSPLIRTVGSPMATSLRHTRQLRKVLTVFSGDSGVPSAQHWNPHISVLTANLHPYIYEI